MRIAIFGLGYVGLTAAGCLARDGHHIIGVDISASKVDQINAGITPISEPGLDTLIAGAVHDGRLVAVQAVQRELDLCEMAIVCVGTPSAPSGAHNMAYIAEVSRQIARAIDPGRTSPLTVVYRSTIRPGTIDTLVEPIFRSVLKDKMAAVEIVYNPEFLRESVAISDFDSPPKIVIGTCDGQPSTNMDAMNAGLPAVTFYTRYREAEITKFIDNTFHALKVSFANEVGRLCLELGISATRVHEIFVSDTKLNVSPYYLRPGGAFGGSCLPKDVRALQYISSDTGISAPVVDSIIRSNEAHKSFLFRHASKGLRPDSRVLVVGLAFKADSDDLRESPNLDFAAKLLDAGCDLRVFDETLDPGKLVGQNLGYGFSHLPTMADILISRDEVAKTRFDRVFDLNGRAGMLELGDAEIIRLDRLP